MQRPKYLYRFRSMADDVQRERVRQILVDNQVYFAPPSSFNDPFDCLPIYDDTATEAEYVRFWTEKFGTDPEGLAKAVTNSRGMIRGDRTHLRASANSLSLLKQTVLNQYGVLCLNSDPFHQLMWSHYADCHKGVCFQFHGEHEVFTNALQVHYANQRPTVNLFTQDAGTLVKNSVGTKSDVWAYEQEWRLVEVDGHGQFQLPREAIAGVILGAKVTAPTIKLIEEWSASSGPAIPVYRARLRGDSYSIEVPGLS